MLLSEWVVGNSGSSASLGHRKVGIGWETKGASAIYGNLLLSRDRSSSVGIEFFAYSANGPIATTCRAVLATVENDLQVKPVPRLHRKKLLQIILGLHDVFSIGQSPSLREPMDMGIDRKSRYAEGLCHDNRRGLVANPR